MNWEDVVLLLTKIAPSFFFGSVSWKYSLTTQDEKIQNGISYTLV